MNFFEYQEAARRQTHRLVAYYVLAVALIILAIYLVTAAIFHFDQASIPGQPFHWEALWDFQLFGIVALATGTLIFSGSLYKIASLSAGGEAVATMLDGRPIAPDTSQFQEKRLLNVVEEMAIASGTPVPRVFVLDHELGINAFAAGFSPKDAVIGVTRGAIETLNREELQGVIGHEFSHILNGDMRLNIRLSGVLNGILVIALTGYWMFRILAQSRPSGSSREKKGNPLALVILLGLAMMIIGYIGVFFARLIKSAVSRQREFLADASSVQFTRNPASLAEALKKIGGLATGSRLQTAAAESASHMFFANGIGDPFFGLLATHPPLEERIRRLDPTFTRETGTLSATPVAGQESAFTETPPPLPIMALSPGHIIKQAGTVSATALTSAAQHLDGIPESLLNAAHAPAEAQSLFFALILDTHPDLRRRQLASLEKHASAGLKQETETLFPELDPIPRGTRMVLANLAIATLKHLPASQYPAFRATVMELAATDGEVSLFEYMVIRMILRTLDPQFGMGKRPRTHLTSLEGLSQETAMVLSAMAWFGTDQFSAAEDAFAAGCRELGVSNLKLLPAEQAGLKAMDTALDRLAETIPPLKQKLVAAVTAAVSADGVFTPDECEALRAVADALDCPLPRILE